MRRRAIAPVSNDAGPVNYTIDVVRFTVVREAAAAPSCTLSEPGAVADLARELIPDDAREHFGILLLNAQNGLIAYHEVSIGTLSASLVHRGKSLAPPSACWGSRH